MRDFFGNGYSCPRGAAGLPAGEAPSISGHWYRWWLAVGDPVGVALALGLAVSVGVWVAVVVGVDVGDAVVVEVPPEPYRLVITIRI